MTDLKNPCDGARAVTFLIRLRDECLTLGTVLFIELQDFGAATVLALVPLISSLRFTI